MTRVDILRSRAALCLILLLAVAPARAAGQASVHEQMELDFARLSKSTSLLWDYGVIRAYANIEKPTVLPRLVGAWRKPPHKPFAGPLRAMLARAVGDRCRHTGIGAEDLSVLRRFNASLAKKDAHVWMQTQAMLAMTRNEEGLVEVEAVASSGERALRRVAAIEALARSSRRAWLQKVSGWFESLLEERKELDRGLIAESIAWAVASVARPFVYEGEEELDEEEDREQDPEPWARAALKVLIDHVEEPRLPERSRAQLARALGWCFGGDVGAEGWRGRLENGAGGPAAGATRERDSVRFMSLEASGQRILFVLDASDSMLTPLTEAEKRALVKLLPKPNKTSRARTRDRGDARPGLAPKTRFDAACLQVAATLRGMKDKHSFAILLFGSEPRLLEATRGFVPATSKAIRRALRALGGVERGKVTASRPYGSLLGNTNIYRALRAAFRVGRRGLASARVGIADKSLLEEGADVLYLLSDGAPTEDGFKGVTPPLDQTVIDGNASGGYRVDPETGRRTGSPGKVDPDAKLRQERKPKSHETGPFIEDLPLTEELERLNLVRRVLIHTVSLGEASLALPRALAGCGRGRMVRVGGSD